MENPVAESRTEPDAPSKPHPSPIQVFVPLHPIKDGTCLTVTFLKWNYLPKYPENVQQGFVHTGTSPPVPRVLPFTPLWQNKQNSKSLDTPQYPEHLSTSASAATRDSGPALGFIYKLSVALTAMVKGQVFPPFPYLQNCPGLFWGTAVLGQPVCEQGSDTNPQGNRPKFSKKNHMYFSCYSRFAPVL